MVSAVMGGKQRWNLSTIDHHGYIQSAVLSYSCLGLTQ